MITKRLHDDLVLEFKENKRMMKKAYSSEEAPDTKYENLWKIFTGNKKPQQLSAGFARGIQMGLKMSPQVKAIGCSNLKTLIEGDKLLINDFDTY